MGRGLDPPRSLPHRPRPNRPRPRRPSSGGSTVGRDLVDVVGVDGGPTQRAQHRRERLARVEIVPRLPSEVVEVVGALHLGRLTALAALLRNASRSPC